MVEHLPCLLEALNLMDGIRRKATMVAKGCINQHLQNPGGKAVSFRPARTIQRV